MSEVSKEYKKLYHYTTLEGLLGIINTQTLWATHGRFLNDSSELVLFKDKLIDLRVPIEKEKLKRLCEQNEDAQKFIDQNGGLDQFSRKCAEVKVETAYADLEEIGEFYIFSFCGEDKNNSYVNRNGLLSQWRGYGAGGGYALVFDTKRLEDIMPKEEEKYHYGDMYICEVIYNDDKRRFKQELRPKIDDIFAFMDECEKRGAKKQEAPEDKRVFDHLGKKAFYALTECMGRYKHQGFKEENEARIVCLPAIHNEGILGFAKEEGAILDPEKERKIRAKNGSPIPYIGLFDSPDITLPIEKIIVGPHKEKKERESALRVMLRNTIEIIVSEIPYVG